MVNKGFTIWPKDYTKEFRFCADKVGKTTHGVANQNTWFAVFCPLAEPAI